MTREEARRRIETLDYSLQRSFGDYGERDHEAMTMAIKALSAEPCEDAISRADTIEWLKRVTVTDGITFETGFKQILTDIQNMPSVTPKQKMGRWIKDNPWTKAYCSECGESCFGLHGFDCVTTDFCPNCGAKMESEDTE